MLGRGLVPVFVCEQVALMINGVMIWNMREQWFGVQLLDDDWVSDRTAPKK